MDEDVQEKEAAGGVRKRRRLFGGGDDGELGAACEKELLLGEDGDSDGEGIAEEAVAEVMRWLEAEISPAAPAPPLDHGFVTINGNEESCGPSFSAAASTVMASVDTRAGAPPPPPVPWPWPEPLLADAEMGTGGDAEAAEEEEEEWLARLLTCGPAPEAEGTLPCQW